MESGLTADDFFEDGWEEVYQVTLFREVCGSERRTRRFRNYRYYQCFGGGPEGGYIVGPNEDVLYVTRNWGTPWSITRFDGALLTFRPADEEKGIPALVIVE